MGGGNNQKAHVKSVNRRIKKQKKWYKWKPKSKMIKNILEYINDDNKCKWAEKLSYRLAIKDIPKAKVITKYTQDRLVRQKENQEKVVFWKSS